MYTAGPKVWVGNLAFHQVVREETEKCTKVNGEKNAVYNMERQETSIVDQGTDEG